MKNTAALKTSTWHAFERDLRRDWDDWSPVERFAVRAVTVSSMLFAALYFGISAFAFG